MGYSIAFGIAAFSAFNISLWGVWGHEITSRNIYFALLAILFQLCSINNKRRNEG